MPGGFHFRTAGQSSGPGMNRERFNSASNRMSLDDLVDQFGFGDAPSGPGTGGGRMRQEGNSRGGDANFFRSGEAGRRAARTRTPASAGFEGRPGEDIRLPVEVPSGIAADG